ncbi:MAG TPA: response regulator transcription factor [Thermomicrobiales bacterium]|nr:response regulator transcription factor [Thermomicrobiales bacterium]
MLARRPVTPSPSPTPTLLRPAPGAGGDLFAAGIPVSLVSTSRLWRESLVAVLAPLLDVRLEGSYSGIMPPLGTPAIARQRLIVLDGSMPLDSLIAWAHHWRLAASAVPIVALDLDNRADLIRPLVQAGVVGYTVRGDGISETVATIRQALYTNAAMANPPPTLPVDDFTTDANGIGPDTVTLTPRELDILRCIAKDYSNKEIARSLAIEVCTVKHHIHNILTKLNTRHRWDAARVAVQHGWLIES